MPLDFQIFQRKRWGSFLKSFKEHFSQQFDLEEIDLGFKELRFLIKFYGTVLAEISTFPTYGDVFDFETIELQLAILTKPDSPIIAGRRTIQAPDFAMVFCRWLKEEASRQSWGTQSPSRSHWGVLIDSEERDISQEELETLIRERAPFTLLETWDIINWGPFDWHSMWKGNAYQNIHKQIQDRLPSIDSGNLPERDVNNMETPIKVFLSHSSKDKPTVRKLAEDLRTKESINAWLDEWEIRGGDSLIDKINEGLAGFDVFLFVISENSVDSKWVREELNTAVIRRLNEENIRIIPVRLDRAAVPPLLSHLKYISLVDYEKGYAELVDDITRKDKRPPLGGKTKTI